MWLCEVAIYNPKGIIPMEELDKMYDEDWDEHLFDSWRFNDDYESQVETNLSFCKFNIEDWESPDLTDYDFTGICEEFKERFEDYISSETRFAFTLFRIERIKVQELV